MGRLVTPQTIRVEVGPGDQWSTIGGPLGSPGINYSSLSPDTMICSRTIALPSDALLVVSAVGVIRAGYAGDYARLDIVVDGSSVAQSNNVDTSWAVAHASAVLSRKMGNTTVSLYARSGGYDIHVISAHLFARAVLLR